MAVFNLYKGDQRVLPFLGHDLTNLVNFKFIWVLSETPDGAPFLTKQSEGSQGIVVDLAEKFVDVHLEVEDFDYDSGIDPGTYHYQLTGIYDDTVPRMVEKGTLIVHHAPYYQHL